MDRARFGGLIKGGGDILQRLFRIILLSGAQNFQVGALERVQAGFDAAVMQTFAGAIPHAAFGRLRVRHISTLNHNFRARNDTATKSIVNREAGATGIPQPGAEAGYGEGRLFFKSGLKPFLIPGSETALAKDDSSPGLF
jgi:hypothetical protein